MFNSVFNKIPLYILPAIILILGIFFGILFQKLIIVRLLKVTKKTKIKLDEIIVKSLKGVIIFWFIILSLVIIVHISHLPQKTLKILNKINLSVFIFSITLLIANILGSFVQYYSDTFKQKSFLPTTIFRTIAKSVIIIIGLLIILQSIGISIAPLLTALGVGGLAVALALQETLSNFFAGIHIIFSGQLKPGDYIRLESGEEGFVTDINWRNTSIRQIPENLIIIPNSKLANSMFTNYNLPKPFLNVLINVGVSYDSDLEKVEKITIQVGEKIMKNVPGGIPDFKPFIRYYEFGDSSINFRVILRAKNFIAKYQIQHEFIKELHKAYKKHNIEIPFPITTVYMKKN